MNYLGFPVTAVARSGVGELVFMRDVPAGATVFECLHTAWEEAQTEARLAYEDWRGQGGGDAYVVYRAAQDRADRAQDSLAGWVARETRASQRRRQRTDVRVASL